jgi:hypothetical protein
MLGRQANYEYGCGCDGAAARLFDTEDGREGVLSFIERREARFTGRRAPHLKEEHL